MVIRAGDNHNSMKLSFKETEVYVRIKNGFHCNLFLLEACTTEVYKKSDGTCACGLFLEDNHSWFDGVDQCSALNARLPEIYSAEENSDLTRVRSFS